VYSVIVGVDEFADAGADWLKFAHRDAAFFGDYLKARQSAKPGAFESIVLVNKTATRTRILDALNLLQRKAGRNDDVYLFVSSSGRATPISQEGVIGTYDGYSEKPDTTIRVSDLRRFLLNCDARRVVLLADVSREQPVTGMDNRINLALRDLKKAKSELWGVLATEPSTASVESKDLEGGYGLFSYFLVRALQGGNGQYPYSAGARPSGGQIGFDRVFGYLEQYVPNLSKQFAKRTQKPIPLNKVAPVTLISRLAPGRWDSLSQAPVLLAQAGNPAPGVLAGQFAVTLDPVTQQALDRFTDILAAGNTLDTGQAAASFDALRSRLTSITGESNRHLLSTVFEDGGQRIVAQYGTGDQFPEDPRKLTGSQFALAGRLFAEALSLREEEGPAANASSFCNGSVRLRNREDILSLESRRQFSSARALLADEMRRPRAAADTDVLDRAGALLDCAIELDPQFPEPRNARGIVKLLKAQFDNAITDFSAAKSLAPDWAYPRHNLALSFIEKGMNAEAEREYREAIERAPYYPYLHYNLGLLLQRQNRRKPAEKAYFQALRMFDEQIQRYHTRESYLHETRESAREEFNRRVADVLALNRAEAENALGTLEQDRGRAGDAEGRFKAALQGNPDLSAARHNLALLYSQTGRPAEAKTLWEENVSRDSAFYPSRLKLGATYLAGNDPGRAREQYDAVLQAAPGNTEARLGVAESFARERKGSEAIRVLRESTQQQGEDGRIAAKLGDLLDQQGDHGAACFEWNQAARLSAYSVTGDRRELKRRLKTCK
jgi:tetratricopeptide (TPR) repeat protein